MTLMDKTCNTYAQPERICRENQPAARESYYVMYIVLANLQLTWTSLYRSL